MSQQPLPAAPDPDPTPGPGPEHDKYEAAKTADYDIPGLQRQPMRALMETARAEGVEAVPGLSKQELIYEILSLRAKRSGVGWGEGILDILPDGFGFLRSATYDFEAGPDDIYVSPAQVRRLNLKPGHTLAGPVRPPKRGEKYFALLHVETVDGATVSELRDRIPFGERSPANPSRALALIGPNTASTESGTGAVTTARVLDLLTPMGYGQRVLVSAPPRSGRQDLLTILTRNLLIENTDLHAIVCLIDERPEDVTEIRSTINTRDRCEVVASTFDQPTSRHVGVAEMALATAMRRVEAGQHVLLVLDSLTTLVRAYNQELPHTGKILTPGLDSGALQRPKVLFGAARDTAEGGSLTVIATLSTHTDSAIDKAIAEEFAGKANCQITLDPRLAERRLEPAVHLHRTGTRAEHTLIAEDRIEGVRRLRRLLAEPSPEAALEDLLTRINSSTDNAALLRDL